MEHLAELTVRTDIQDHDCAETVTWPGLKSVLHMASNVRDNTELHRFELDADGHVAFSNYKRADGVLTILHTEMPKALEGRGIGSALMRGVLDSARAQGLKVNPVCPFAKSLYRAAPRIRRLAA